MEPEITEKLLQMSNSIEDFASEQLPDIFNQIILLGRVINTSVFALAAISTLSMLLYVRYSIKCSKGDISSHEKNKFTNRAITAGMFSIPVAVSMCVYGYYAALAWFAPKLYVIDYLLRSKG